MGKQDLLPGFDKDDLRPKPKSRRSSGGEKKKAAERKSGQMSNHCDLVLSELCLNPGRTGAELCNILYIMFPSHGVEMNVYKVRRRLSDLKRMGLARQGKSRKCDVTGTRVVTWWPVGRTEALLQRGHNR